MEKYDIVAWREYYLRIKKSEELSVKKKKLLL
jgi:hypothetical protein